MNCLLVVNIAIRWSDSADDARIHAMATRFIECSVATAKDMKLHHKYIYQNYASSNQNVFASYGLKNKDRLTRISQETDPKRIFQRLQPGYFKLDDGTLYD